MKFSIRCWLVYGSILLTAISNTEAGWHGSIPQQSLVKTQGGCIAGFCSRRSECPAGHLVMSAMGPCAYLKGGSWVCCHQVNYKSAAQTPTEAQPFVLLDSKPLQGANTQVKANYRNYVGDHPRNDKILNHWNQVDNSRRNRKDSSNWHLEIDPRNRESRNNWKNTDERKETTNEDSWKSKEVHNKENDWKSKEVNDKENDWKSKGENEWKSKEGNEWKSREFGNSHWNKGNGYWNKGNEVHRNSNEDDKWKERDVHEEKDRGGNRWGKDANRDHKSKAAPRSWDRRDKGKRWRNGRDKWKGKDHRSRHGEDHWRWKPEDDWKKKREDDWKREKEDDWKRKKEDDWIKKKEDDWKSKKHNNRRVTTPLPDINERICGYRDADAVVSRRHYANSFENASVIYPDLAKNVYPTDAIVGGEEAKPFSWPWVAALYKVTPTALRRFLSAGSLINKNFILTAAHAFTPKDLRSTPFVVMLGTHTTNEAIATYEVHSILVHPEYETRYYYHDIALLKLKKPVVFNDYVMPICLPTPYSRLLRDEDLEGKSVTVMGWGDESFGGVSSRVLKEATFQIVSRKICNDSYTKVASNRFPRGITNEMICAGDPKGGKDACQGDSGGPLTMKEGQRYTQVGIVSFGYQCGDKEYPGVYTKVQSYLNWIVKSTLEGNDYEVK